MNNIVDHPCLQRRDPRSIDRRREELAENLDDSVVSLEWALSNFRHLRVPRDRKQRHVDLISRLVQLIGDGRALRESDVPSAADVERHLDRLNELILEVRQFFDDVRTRRI